MSSKPLSTRATSRELLQMAAELEGTKGLPFNLESQILYEYSVHLCSEVFGLRPGVRIKDESSVHGLSLQAVVAVVFDAGTKVAHKHLTSIYASGSLMRSATTPYVNRSAGRELRIAAADLEALEALAAEAWIAREDNPDKQSQALATESSNRMLAQWVRSHYGIYEGGIAESFKGGPFTVEKLSFDLAAQRIGSVGLNISGHHMRGRSTVSICTPLLYADLSALS